MNAKRIIAAVLVLIMISAFASCKQGADKDTQTEYTSEEVVSQSETAEEISQEPEESGTSAETETQADETTAQPDTQPASSQSAPDKSTVTSPKKTTAKQTTAAKSETSSAKAQTSTKKSEKTSSAKTTTGAAERTHRFTTSASQTQTQATTTRKQYTTPVVTVTETAPTTAKPSPSSTQATSATKTTATQPKAKTVKVTIDFTNAVNYGKQGLPSNTTVEVEYEEGDTGRSVLEKAAAKSDLEVTGRSDYVTGIGGLKEKKCGPESGWLYSVNGVYPNKGANSYKVQPGDEVVWIYTVKMGDTGYTG